MMDMTGQKFLGTMKIYLSIRMNILIVTEKYGPNKVERDGGARLVDTLQQAFGKSLSVMQFGLEADPNATWHFDYPVNDPDRFKKRIANANFIAERIREVEHLFTHIIFVHISMQFGLVNLPVRNTLQIWTFPMFLTPSYIASGEKVPPQYTDMERLTLANSKNIITPSHFEKKQLTEFFSVPPEYIKVIPRGINTKFINRKVRHLNGAPIFCNVGSIKPQKNTLGLVELFAEIHSRHPDATIKIIGPIQDSKYFNNVLDKIKQLDLAKFIEFTGYIAPSQFATVINDAHIHLSMSTCETFGRSIFETLASGLPNIVKAENNAAIDFLKNSPYIHFIDDKRAILPAVEAMLNNLSQLSSMALEVGNLFDDEILYKLIVAEICNREVIGISDYDGTLFHKDDPEKTKKCIDSFRCFPLRVICSARSIGDLLEQLKFYNLEVDWLVGYSGTMAADGLGNALWLVPMKASDIKKITSTLPLAEVVKVGDEVLQIASPIETLPDILGLRIEVYQKTAYVFNWEASKLRAILKLLRHINWSGRVSVIGDGKYDEELLAYFDGHNAKTSF
jgi:glycosyltransferase involved in cell wall biosynthesis